MKRLVVIFTAVMLLLSQLSSCNDKGIPESFDPSVYVERLKDYCKTYGIKTWQEAAAIFNCGLSLSDYNVSLVSSQDDSEAKRNFSQALIYLLKKLQGIEENSTELAGYSYFLDVRDFSSLSTEEIALYLYCCVLDNTDFERDEAADALRSRMKSNGGVTYVREYAEADAESTSYALICAGICREEFENEEYDSLLYYLITSLDDETSLYINREGKQTSTANALAVMAFINAGAIPDGETAFALTSAIERNFLSGRGYSALKDGEYDIEATGEVYLCYSFTAFGSLWEKIISERISDNDQNIQDSH